LAIRAIKSDKKSPKIAKNRTKIAKNRQKSACRFLAIFTCLTCESVAENLNAQGVVAKFVDGWVIFAIDWRRIYVNIEINTI